MKLLLENNLVKKHYIGAVYDLTQENMNHLIKQLEEANDRIKLLESSAENIIKLYNKNISITKNEWITVRTDIISKMLDNPDEYGIYPTTICFAELDDLYDQLTLNENEPMSEAQKLRGYKCQKINL